ncbi:heterokaryon incompatibility domain-containing protein [Trichoderma austrokoningii]
MYLAIAVSLVTSDACTRRGNRASNPLTQNNIIIIIIITVLTQVFGYPLEERQWSGVCLFELNPTAKCLPYIRAFKTLEIEVKEATWNPDISSPGSAFLETTTADETKQILELCCSEASLDKPKLFANELCLQTALRRGYKLSVSTSDDRSLSQASDWLTKCRTYHDQCRAYDTKFVPSRLPYLGTKQTNSSTIELVKTTSGHSMPMANLSEMMQDAVSVLRRLGIEYVWIDYWKKEAALMGNESVWFGHPITENPDMEWPILSQGRTYQEQLLSRRIVHFIPNELVWECLEETQCDCGWLENNVRHQGAIWSCKRAAAENSWVEVIKEYAKRPLTVAMDRIPALGGIAKTTVYLCGLCSSRGIEFLGSDVKYASGSNPFLGDVASRTLSLAGHVVSGQDQCYQERISFLLLHKILCLLFGSTTSSDTDPEGTETNLLVLRCTSEEPPRY